MSYTKGKWYFKDGYVRESNMCAVICHVHGTEKGNSAVVYESRANARLIAAAPDLLEACKIAFNLLDSEPMPTPETESVIEKLSFAIGNAEPGLTS